MSDGEVPIFEESINWTVYEALVKLIRLEIIALAQIHSRHNKIFE